jgi:antibiotic biosynthesis monooxygenase (ABM) superfamily enzyme
MIPSPAPHPPTSRLRLFLLNWACIFPGVLLLNALTERVLGRLALPGWARVGIVTGLLTFGIVYFVGPWLERTFQAWLRKDSKR